MRRERARQCSYSLVTIELAFAQPRILHRRLLQLQHQVFAFDQEIAELLAVFLLVQLLDVVEFHVPGSRATASATLMPSTPADRMPPA